MKKKSEKVEKIKKEIKNRTYDWEKAIEHTTN